MSTRRATFTITCGSQGVGSDDVQLPLPSTLVRHGWLDFIAVDRSQAFAGSPTITLSALEDVSDEDWNSSDEQFQLGEQLAYIDFKNSGNAARVFDERFYPRHPVVDEFGAATATDARTGRVPITTKNLRVEVYSGRPGDVYTVDVYYETSGDYRF